MSSRLPRVTALHSVSRWSRPSIASRSWTAGENALEHLAVLYAIEASQPAIAQTKLDGLVERYGYSPEGPAVEYFQLHATLDVEHARQARELIVELMSEDGAEAHEHPEGTQRADRMVELATARCTVTGSCSTEWTGSSPAWPEYAAKAVRIF